jgi:mRNA-degrading endonuclease toxin of MazEF toxin-antitoxin module
VVDAGDGGLAEESVALCHQIRVSDKSRLRLCLGQVAEATMAKVALAMDVTLAT